METNTLALSWVSWERAGTRSGVHAASLQCLQNDGTLQPYAVAEVSLLLVNPLLITYLIQSKCFNMDTRQWSIACPLPRPFTFATAAVCGDRLYLLGGHDGGFDWTHSVFSASVTELLQSCQVQPRTMKKEIHVWRRIADAPFYHSSCANVCGWLVAIGGDSRASECTSAICVYDEVTDSWQAMQHMPVARRKPLVAVFPGKMMVVGGLNPDILNAVDMVTF